MTIIAIVEIHQNTTEKFLFCAVPATTIHDTTSSETPATLVSDSYYKPFIAQLFVYIF